MSSSEVGQDPSLPPIVKGGLLGGAAGAGENEGRRHTSSLCSGPCCAPLDFFLRDLPPAGH